jgi:Ras-related protein Rab-8A
MGIVLTYAVNERESFQAVENWMKQIKLHASDNVVKVLVGNKCDMPNREVSYKEGEKMAQELGMMFF